MPTPARVFAVATIGGVAKGKEVKIGDVSAPRENQLGLRFTDCLRDLAKLGEVKTQITKKTRASCHKAALAALKKLKSKNWKPLLNADAPPADHYWDDGWRPCPVTGCPVMSEAFPLEYKAKKAIEPMLVARNMQALECHYYIVVEYAP